MAQRDFGRPQLLNEQLVADIIRALQVLGQYGPAIDVIDSVQPVFLAGQIDAIEATTSPVAYTIGETFNASRITAAGGVLDTGQLVAGTYDVQLLCSENGQTAVNNDLFLRHRDAANAATLRFWPITQFNAAAQGSRALFISYTMALVIGTNERLDVLNEAALTNGELAVTMMVKRRST